ncbi:MULTISPECIES: response regulator [unclassified Paenibacillus]|uniref:response regulator n=1 Tax=unclassified Paenibacillus TaxID=185978 RepID=UPI00363BC93B
MRVLLVDDKESVVQGIRKHISWEELGITHVDIALDGKEALAKFDAEPADLVVTDIKMPNMNGIELMERLRHDYDHVIRFVVLSGYEEFDYAKQALALGASDYVLKPVDIKELTVILEKVVLELKKVKEQDEQKQRFQQTIRRSLPALRQQYLNEMVHFRDHKLVRSKDKWEFAEIPLRSDYFALLAIAIDDFQTISQNSVEEVELSRFVVENIIGDCLPAWGTGITFYSEWGILTLLVNYDLSMSSKEVKDLLLKFAEHCRSSIEVYSNHTVTIGISSPCPEITGLPDAYKEACEAIDHIYFFGNNQVMHVEDLLPFRMKRTGYPVVEEQELFTLIRRGQVESVAEGVAVFFNALKGSESTPADFRISCIQLVTMLIRLLLDVGVQVEERNNAPETWYHTCEHANLTELQEQMAGWFYEATLQVKQYMQLGTKNIVGEAKAFIQQQLLQQVGLSEVADHVGVSPNYLSSLFKRETGTTFVEYITDLKLEKAKVWLEDAGIPIYEIAERLGYLDRKYFREIFKKKLGITPSEYREQRLGMK